MVISGGKWIFSHEIPKEKWQLLKALGVAYYLGTGAQASVMSEQLPTVLQTASSSVLDGVAVQQKDME